MDVAFLRLTEVDKSVILELMNDTRVRKHMPLLKKPCFDEEDCDELIATKLWKKEKHGPWALVSEEKFMGWAGIQHEEEGGSITFVLHPHYWGKGVVIFKQILRHAFEELKFKSVTVLLPPSRGRFTWGLRHGFQPDGEQEIQGERFLRYRLDAKLD